MLRKACILILASFLASGCWDRVEIEERGFVVGMAVDEAKDPNKIVLTNQFVVPERLHTGGGGSEMGSGGEDAAYRNISSEGESVASIIGHIATMASRAPYYEHIKNVIISESIAKSGRMTDVLDFCIRDNEIRRSTYIFLTKGEARKALAIRTSPEKLPALFLTSLLHNNYRTTEIIPLSWSKLGQVHTNFLRNQSFCLPVIVLLGKDTSISGVGVIHGTQKRLVGYLDPQETIGLNYVRGEIQGGNIAFTMGRKAFVFEIKDWNTKVEEKVSSNNQNAFKITISVKGNIAEDSNLDWTDKKVIEKAQKMIEQQIEQTAVSTIKKVQGEYKTDVLGLGILLKENHFSYWESIQKNWDAGKNYFSKSKIQVSAKVKIVNSATIKKSYGEKTQR